MPFGLHPKPIRRVSRASAVTVAIALAVPAGAGAHVRSGVVAVSYTATVGQIPRGLRVGIDQSDRAVRLTVADGHTAVVLGYLGEPVARIGAKGLAVNDAAPTAAGFGLVKASRQPSRPAFKWRRRSATRTVVWHDARLRGLPSGVRRGRWAIPVRLDGRRVELRGELTRTTAPAWWPWLLLALPFVAATAMLLARRGSTRERGAVVLGALAGITTLMAAVAFSVDRYASAGTWVESGNEAFLGLLALGLLWSARDAPTMRFGAIALLGSLGVLLAMTKAAVFTNGIVLAAIPAEISRLAVAVSASAGAAALIVAVGFFFQEGLTTSAETRRSPPAGDFWSTPVDRERHPYE
jgi:hypothetical protein